MATGLGWGIVSYCERTTAACEGTWMDPQYRVTFPFGSLAVAFKENDS